MQVGKVTTGQIIFFVMLICGAMLYFGITQWIIPKYSQITDNQAVIEKKTKDLREIEQIKVLLVELRKEIKDLLRESSYLEEALLEKEFIPTILLQIEQLGTATNISITSLKPKAELKAAPTPTPRGKTTYTTEKTSTFSPDAEYSKINIDMNLEATFRTLMSFLGELITFPKPVIVEGIDLQTSSKQVSVPVEGKKEGEKEGEQQQNAPLSVKMPISFYVAKKTL